MRPLGTRYTNLHAPYHRGYPIGRCGLFTPLLRRGFWFGFVLALAVGLYFADEEHRENLRAFADDVHRSIIERPEFMVSAAQISGAGPTLEEEFAKFCPSISRSVPFP